MPFIANLSKDEFEKVSQKIEDMQSDALVSDLNSLGFWAIDSFSDYLKVFDSKLVKKIDLKFMMHLRRNLRALKFCLSQGL